MAVTISNDTILDKLRNGSAKFELVSSAVDSISTPNPVQFLNNTSSLFFARIGLPQSRVSSSNIKVERYTILKVTGDGRCMFRALVKGMARNKGITLTPQQERDNADELRAAVKEVICENENERRQYQEAVTAITVDEPLHRYCQRIGRHDFWGGESELLQFKGTREMIGGSGMDMRSKARTLNGPVSDPKELPEWNYDGSSTGQAPGEDSEVILYPQAIFKDPFRRGNNILVMCDAYTSQGKPIPTNKRHDAAKIFSHPDVAAEVPWYGIEQEYTLLQKDVHWPIGWPVGGFPGPQGPYYCSIGADKAFGRDIVDSHYKACLYAGINISGINGEVMPGQWEFQVGPSVGISAGDELWVARYILERITEIAGVALSFDPKPIPGDWNGAGAHTNYSTKSMREEGGYEIIKQAIEKLALRHKEHIAAYGEGNERRLTGKHETASISTFLWGVANRGASVRVGRDTEKEGKGYFEDRRPASNMDPYVVSSMIAETTILWKP